MKDMSGTARCDGCGVGATYERGIGSPLSIRHKKDCPVEADYGPSGPETWDSDE